MDKLNEAFQLAESIIDAASSATNKVWILRSSLVHRFVFHFLENLYFIFQGYIIQKKEKRPKENEEFVTNQEFHPMIFMQHKDRPFIEYDSFDKAIDEFFSNLEGQKIDIKGVQQV